MNKALISLIICTLIIATSCYSQNDQWIRINQLGYRTGDIKVAVFISNKEVLIQSFKVLEVPSGKVAVTFHNVLKEASLEPFATCYRLPFSALKKSGTYRIEAGNAVSPDFRIADNVYDGTADFLLNYMRQQRCGFNPYLMDSCHMSDGYEIYRKQGDSTHINVTGGWHDAADYLQYVATSANAAYQMLFAFDKNPASFTDKYLANGLPGSDGIPDVLNESKWGLDWLLKMNPEPGVMYNQIADDRDHIGFRFPDEDTAKYGKGRERPVYYCTGKPQGLFKYKNRTTGIASTAGKFASAFAKGAMVYKIINPTFAKILTSKAIAAFETGLRSPGVCQTAPGTAPYFYEEENWTDDMELAAIELFSLTNETKYFNYALEFGRKEIVTPWIGSDTALHYQWYPFVNMGHPAIAMLQKAGDKNEFAGYMKKGLSLTGLKAKNNPFHIGIPFIWCSNNLIAGILTQAQLYSEITGDKTFAELEAAHRDWLFGCNPWGTSMIVGLPEKGDYPVNTHSSYVVKGGQVTGGLIDGPVYPTIFNSLKYIYLSKRDQYAAFQTKLAVYHDDYADYSTNECTMDGTASLVYYLSSLNSRQPASSPNPKVTTSRGAIVRMDSTKKEVWLCFTAHDFNDGFGNITRALRKHGVKASFFLTGDFCRSAGNTQIINTLKSDGHYIGMHSDKHLLYCSWEKRDSLLVSKEQFISDLSKNLIELEKIGIQKDKAKVFLPPYEWYNDSIAFWTGKAGLQLVNISSGTIVNQDWTFPGSGKYYSSNDIMKDFISYEKKRGMNGYILLIHPGTDPRRTDKFYYRIDSVLTYLEKKNYRFRSFSEIN